MESNGVAMMVPVRNGRIYTEKQLKELSTGYTIYAMYYAQRHVYDGQTHKEPRVEVCFLVRLDDDHPIRKMELAEEAAAKAAAQEVAEEKAAEPGSSVDDQFAQKVREMLGEGTVVEDFGTRADRNFTPDETRRLMDTFVHLMEENKRLRDAERASVDDAARSSDSAAALLGALGINKH